MNRTSWRWGWAVAAALLARGAAAQTAVTPKSPKSPATEETWQERYAAQRLGQLAGAHLTRDAGTGRVKSLGLVNAGPTNEALSLAVGLPALEELEIVAMPYEDFDDRGLAYAGAMSQLRRLQVVGSRVSDGGVASLANLKKLEQLSLDAPISDAGLQSLQSLTGLRLLDLYGTRVSGHGFASLAGLNQLEFLCLDRTQVSDGSLPTLAGLTGLKTLLLRETPISDAGLGHLARLENLERLDLDRTTVTERGLAALAGTLDPSLMEFAGPTQLRSLSLRGAPNLRGDNLSSIANLYGLPYFRKLDVLRTPLAADKAKAAQLIQAYETVEHWRLLPTVRSEGPIVRFDENLDIFGLYFVEPSFAISREALEELFLVPPLALQELSLRGSALRRGDARQAGDLESLSKLANLRKLNLYGTGIADADLQQLVGLKNLREVYLSETDTGVTAKGEQALIDAIPGVQVIRLP